MPFKRIPREQRTKRKSFAYAFCVEFCAGGCVICGSDYDMHVDHIIPLAAGGTNDPSNLQPLCGPCNSKKNHTRTNDEMRAWYDANKASIDQDRRFREYNRGSGYDRNQPPPAFLSHRQRQEAC